MKITSTDLQKLQEDIEASTIGTKSTVLKTNSGDLKGVPYENIPPSSPCAQMKWVYDNTGYRMKPYFELDFEDARQGIRVFKDETLVKSFAIPVTGNNNGDPTKQISINMYKMIKTCTEFINEKL